MMNNKIVKSCLARCLTPASFVCSSSYTLFYTPYAKNPNMEQLTSHPSVIGTIIVSRTDNAIIKTTGHIFDGEGGKRYAAAVESIVKGVADALTACNDAENVGILLTSCLFHNSASQR